MSQATLPIVGLHHVTAIVSDPQRNLDFYAGVLGLRFVKRTVNFDDPGTYHFYFGDDAGSPGTIYTSFPWPHAQRGRAGAGETTHIAYQVAAESVAYWQQRLESKGVDVVRSQRFGADVLTFADPDGMGLELVGQEKLVRAAGPSRFSDVPAEHALAGFAGATLLERSLAATEPTLNRMGWRQVQSEGSRVRFEPEVTADPMSQKRDMGHPNYLDVVVDAAAGPGRTGAGTVHHIAFRTQTDESQLAWRAKLSAPAAPGQTLSVTTVQDRDYFHSIYFREPGGVLFELATDPPGFATDEPVETLGEALCIPKWLEPRREWIEQKLLPIVLDTKVKQ